MLSDTRTLTTGRQAGHKGSPAVAGSVDEEEEER